MKEGSGNGASLSAKGTWKEGSFSGESEAHVKLSSGKEKSLSIWAPLEKWCRRGGVIYRRL